MKKAFIRRFSFVLLMIVMVLSVVACKTVDPIDPDDPKDPVTYTVTFEPNGGSAVTALTVEENKKVEKPTDPTKEGFTFEYWYLTDDKVAFDFQTLITANTTLNAKWEAVVPVGKTDEELIAEDIALLEADFYVNELQLNLPVRGEISRSRVAWKSNSSNVSNTGVILPRAKGSAAMTAEIKGTFTLNKAKVEHLFSVTVPEYKAVEIKNTRVVPFENLTTEYTVEKSNINLYFEADGSVPYVSVIDFLGMLDGFIDSEVDFTFTRNTDTLEIFYQYYDEDEDETYDLLVTLNAATNQITTNDPAFYWAYVYSTETNYGRHIEYDNDNPDAYFDEGSDVIYDLESYNLEMTIYDDKILLPYYIVNQLFAGSSYYNVYYNSEGLFGIYSLPDSSSSEYRTMKTSALNNTNMPADLLVHNFNILAFNMDNFYGLKDIMEVDSYYPLLMGNLNGLLSNKPQEFEEALFTMIMKEIDELHTSYGYPSYFNKSNYEGPELTSVGQFGTRGQDWYQGGGEGFFDVQDEINAKWGKVDDRPYYWFLDTQKTSVMITLDGFDTADIEESATYDAAIAGDVFGLTDIQNVLPTIASGNKFFYYNSGDDQDDMIEILVKGVSETYVATYKQALTTFGYTYEYDSANKEISKNNGYYTIKVADINYMVQVAYDTDYDLFYVSLVNKIPTSFSGPWPLIVDVVGLVNSDSAVYLEMMMDQILSQTTVLKNVTIDLTYNTGGNVGALYRVVGFVTDQPFRVSSIDGDTGGASSSFVKINGTPTYPNLKWSLLTSKVTFSAANSLATIFKENKLGKIMGVKSGGGASSITPILLPTGTAFTMSSNNISAYRTGAGTENDPFVFHSNEFGITPDYKLEMSELYKESKLLSILN